MSFDDATTKKHRKLTAEYERRRAVWRGLTTGQSPNRPPRKTDTRWLGPLKDTTDAAD